MKIRTNSAHSQAGVALIEFAIILPVMMLLLIGLIELGRLAYFTIEVGNAAHAGAEFGSMSSTNAANTTAITNAVTQDGQNSISALNVSARNVCSCWNGTVDVPSPPTNATCGQTCASGHAVTYVQVTVTGTIAPLINYGALGLPNSWTVTRTATSFVVPKQ